MIDKNRNNICPYCGVVISTISKDHIFPDFLGGTKKTDSCPQCNNLFGHTFEARNAKAFQALHVFISSWGLNLKKINAKWENAFNYKNKTYNLSVGKHGLNPELTRPFIEKDKQGNIIAGEFNNKKDAEKFANNLIAKGKATKIKIEYTPFPEEAIKNLSSTLVIGPDIKRLALKMCIGLYTLFEENEEEEISNATFYLNKECHDLAVESVVASYEVYESLDLKRKALSHTIYIERNQSLVYGVVQFYGVIQLYCYLGGASESFDNEHAMIGTLDPVTGEEIFSTISPLKLPEPPVLIKEEEYPMLLNRWLDKYRSESIKRGATKPPNLKIDSINLGS